MKLKILDRIGIFFDSIKNSVFRLLALILIVLLIGSIVHNVLKLEDMANSYKGPYKNRIEINEKKLMNIYTIGEGDKTIVILSGFGIQSPVLEYKALANALSSNYRVVILEYYGYGFSTKATEDRTNENIAKEIQEGLQAAGIQGPYILMPHSISNLYALKYAQIFPEDVLAIVSLDGLFPAELEINSKESDYIYNLKSDIRFAWVIEKTGYMRLLTYVKPEMFRFDKMKDKLNYSDDDISLYKKFIATKYLTPNMMNEIDNIEKNITDLNGYKYPVNLPVLNILSSETLDNKEYTDNLKTLIGKLITNSVIQQNVIVSGSHYLEIDNIPKIVESTNNFLNQISQEKVEE